LAILSFQECIGNVFDMTARGWVFCFFGSASDCTGFSGAEPQPANAKNKTISRVFIIMVEAWILLDVKSPPAKPGAYCC
jgi:hypothetical protein